jgi:hypothetical protein
VDLLEQMQHDLAELKQQLRETTTAQAAVIVPATQRIQLGLSQVIVGSTTATITWPRLWADPGYFVIATLQGGGALSLGNLVAGVVAGSQSNTSCQIIVVNSTLATIGAVQLDVLGIHL